MNKRLRGEPELAVGAQAPAAALDLDHSLTELERRLAALRQALSSGQADALDDASAQLQTCVARTGALVQQLGSQHVASISPHRQRLKLAVSELQAQREAVARASAALERAAQVLMPADGHSYDAQGLGLRHLPNGGLTA